jgi:hypothetical protein
MTQLLCEKSINELFFYPSHFLFENVFDVIDTLLSVVPINDGIKKQTKGDSCCFNPFCGKIVEYTYYDMW